jgi:hypothetical protein
MHPERILTLVLALGFPTVGAAQRFEWFFPIEVGRSVEGVDLGDVDRDGDLDILIGRGRHWPTPSLVYSNTGYGNFYGPRPLEGRDQRTSVALLGDVDRDRDLDAVLLSEQGQHTVHLNDGFGTFTAASRFGTGREFVQDGGLSDVDRDGDLDVVMAIRGSSSAVYLNNGFGVFSNRVAVGRENGGSFTVATADFNGDGRMDLALAGRDPSSTEHAVFLQDSTGRFGTRLPFGDTLDAVSALEPGDLDGDGDIDIAVGVIGRRTATGDQIGARNHVLLNDGRGHLAHRIDFGPADQTFDLALGDVDGNGDLDVAVVNQSTDVYYQTKPPYDRWFLKARADTNRVYFNNGRGQFTAGPAFGTLGVTSRRVRLVDVDGDQRLDIVEVRREGVVVIHLNTFRP